MTALDGIKRLGILSPGIRRMAPVIEPVFDVTLIDLSWSHSDKSVDAIAGWGHKPTAARARTRARRRGLPYIALEDGFLRSVGLGKDGAPPLSLIADPIGIYYDANGPSALENLLNDGSWIDDTWRDAGKRLIDRIRASRLSKYNAFADADDAWMTRARDRVGTGRVLVVDQTFGDASVDGGLADADTFRRMLDAARLENPDAELWIKTHPDVVAGKVDGYFGSSGPRGPARVIAETVNPWDVINQVDRVYTVSSQLGVEALMAGVPVTCFGMPFYAGWGVTDDRAACDRRMARRTVEEIVAAAYLRYPVYLDPYRRKRCPVDTALDHLERLIGFDRQDCRPAVCIGVSWWKRKTIARFFGPALSPPTFAKDDGVDRARQISGQVFVWSTREPDALATDAKTSGIPLSRIEDGFIRSIGLGARLTPPASIVVDDLGIYYDPRTPSRLETLLATHPFPTDLLDRARRLRREITARSVSKYNLQERPLGAKIDPSTTVVFVPGQVEDDASVKFGAPDIGGNEGLLGAVRARNPDAFILFKPHPDVESGYRRGYLPERKALAHADLVVRDVTGLSLVDRADRIETMTSLIGFEALLRGKDVVCHGRPFYSGWGLTQDLIPSERRNRPLTIDALVAATLILYPRYIDPITKQRCDPEFLIERIANGDRAPPDHRFPRPLSLAWHALAVFRRMAHRFDR